MAQLLKAGTYKWNNELSFPAEGFSASINFTVSTTYIDTNTEVIAYCSSLEYDTGTPMLYYFLDNYIPNFDANGTIVKAYGNYNLDGLNIWNPHFEEDFHTITVTEDTEVTDDFLTWFTANAKPVITLGNYRFNDVLTKSAQDIYETFDFYAYYCISIRENYSGRVYCTSMKTVVDQDHPFELFYTADALSEKRDQDFFGEAGYSYPYDECVYVEFADGSHEFRYVDGTRTGQFIGLLEDQVVNWSFWEWFSTNTKKQNAEVLGLRRFKTNSYTVFDYTITGQSWWELEQNWIDTDGYLDIWIAPFAFSIQENYISKWIHTISPAITLKRIDSDGNEIPGGSEVGIGLKNRSSRDYDNSIFTITEDNLAQAFAGFGTDMINILAYPNEEVAAWILANTEPVTTAPTLYPITGIWRVKEVPTFPTSKYEDIIEPVYLVVNSVNVYDEELGDVVHYENYVDTVYITSEGIIGGNIWQADPPEHWGLGIGYENGAWIERWGGNMLRVWDFGAEPQYVSEKFWNWMQANTIKNWYDLATLVTASGNYSIKVRAFKNGKYVNEFSDSLPWQYRKEVTT